MIELHLPVFTTKNLLLLMIIAVTTSVTLPPAKKLKRVLGYEEESLMDFPEMVESYGYKSETHYVVTEDGYILKLFRILKGEGCGNKPPVLMGHGFLLTAESYIDSGPEAGLAYLLSDACFDVWVANQRGTFHGRNHTTFKPDIDKRFWEFSYQDMGKYDQPAFVDFILRNTDADYLNYIGYSQNGAIFNIMCSERPEYNDKIGVSLLMAPTSRMKNTRSKAVRLITSGAHYLAPLYVGTGTTELLARYSITQTVLQFLCQFLQPPVCESFVVLLDSYHKDSITDRTLKVMSGNMPSGTSRQALRHFEQAIKSDDFYAYDYGMIKNKQVYGTVKPPKFNLTAVTTDIVLIAGLNDHNVDIKDVKWLSTQLPNVIDFIVMEDKLWNHFDFPFSQFVPDKLAPMIIKYLNDYS